MLQDEALRFIDDKTFAEAEPPADRSRPLEWRRSFNTISFVADDLAVEYAYFVNEVDHFASLRDSSESLVVSPAACRRLRVTCEVSHDKLRDSIFCTKEMEKGSGLYKLHCPKDDIRLILTGSEPIDERGPFAAGAFGGFALLTDFEPGEDGLCIEVGVPTQHLEEIVAALKAGEASALQVAIAIQSFSYEVDDALREWYHRRDLFVHGATSPAALLSLRLLQQKPEAESPSTPPPDDTDADSSVAPLIPHLLQASTTDYSALLKGIRTVLWVIAAILLFQLAK